MGNVCEDVDLPMVAIPAPITIRTNPKANARHACHRHLDVIFPRTICTFHVAPDAGQARRTGPPNEIFRRLCHFAATPRAYIFRVNHQSNFSTLFCFVWCRRFGQLFIALPIRNYENLINYVPHYFRFVSNFIFT